MNNFSIQMAPFQGITNRVFRKVYTRHFTGIDKLFTPFFTGIQKQKLSLQETKELGNTHENNIPVIPQILSKDAAEIERFAILCHQLGFTEINWNLGCPYPRVANKGRGSGMLLYPDKVDKILCEVMDKIPVKLSVKLRLGYLDDTEIFKLLPVFNRYPIQELTVHARIGKQLYKGSVNRTVFEEVLKQSEIPVGYNGDIFTKDDSVELLQQFPNLKFVMLGRGLLVDPFLPAYIKGYNTPELSQQKPAIRKFVDDLYYHRRKQHHDGLQTLGNMKEYWWYLAYSFSKPHKVFGRIKKVKSFNDYEDAVNAVFNDFEWLGQQANLFKKEKNR